MKTARLLALAIPALLVVAGPAAAKPSFKWPDWDALSARYPGVGAVCLVHEDRNEVADLGGDDYGMRRNVTWAIAILDPGKAAGWLEWTLPHGEWHKITKLEARTWTAADKNVEVKKDRVFNVASFPDYVLFQDIEGKRFAFPSVAARTVIELKYSATLRWSFTLDHSFASSIPVEDSRAVLLVPRYLFSNGFDQIIRAQGLIAEPSRQLLGSAEGELVEMTWQMQSLPAIPFETAMPPMDEVSPRVRVVPLPPRGEKNDWNTLGRRYWESYFHPQMSKAPAVVELAQSLTQGVERPEDKVRRLTRFVAGDIRYVAIELGIGGIRPHPAAEVLKNRYGDCKDKVCLLLSLLSAVGIEGEPALVRTFSEGEVDSALVDMDQFNHMIARVPMGERVWWIDPTATGCPPDFLPGADQGTRVLVVGPGNARIEQTPITTAESSLATTVLDAGLEDNGRLVGTMSIEATGEEAWPLRGALRSDSDDERKRRVGRMLERRLPGSELIDFEIGALDSADVPLRVRIDFARSGVGVAFEDRMVVPFEAICPPRFDDPFKAAERVHPVITENLWAERRIIRIRPPAAYKPESAPPAASLGGRYFAFTLESRAEDNTLVVERNIATRVLSVPVRQYGAARDELGKIRAASADPLTFRRASP